MFFPPKLTAAFVEWPYAIEERTQDLLDRFPDVCYIVEYRSFDGWWRFLMNRQKEDSPSRYARSMSAAPTPYEAAVNGLYGVSVLSWDEKQALLE